MFTDKSYWNVLPSRAIRTSSGLIERKRHIRVKTAHSLQEDIKPTQMDGLTLHLSDQLDALYSNFTSGEVREGSDSSYRA